MLIRLRKAQSTLEYALLIGVVVGALIAMQNYLKRSMMGRLQAVGDQIGDQYSPGLTFRQENMSVNIATITETTHGGTNGNFVTNIEGADQTSNTIRNIQSLDNEEWFEDGV